MIMVVYIRYYSNESILAMEIEYFLKFLREHFFLLLSVCVYKVVHCFISSSQT